MTSPCSCWPLTFPCKRCLQEIFSPSPTQERTIRIMAQKKYKFVDPAPVPPPASAVEALVKALEPLDASARKRAIKAALILLGK